MPTTGARFVGRLSIAGVGLLILLYIAVPMAIWRASGTPSGWISGCIITGPYIFLFWLFVCALWWNALKRRARRVNMRKRTLAFLALLPVLLLGGWAIYREWPSVRAAHILAYAGLAPLPESATQLKVYSWSALFSGEWRLGFRADRADLERFLQASPILRNAEYREYSPARMRLPAPDDAPIPPDEDPNGPDYFHPGVNVPPWYLQEIRVPARRYQIHPASNISGEVIVHTEANLVFVHLSHG